MTAVLPDQTPVPSPSTDDARTPRPRWRRRPTNRPGRPLPYLLLAPTVVVLALVLGYPLVRLAVMSTQRFGMAQQFGTPPESVGLANFRAILTDDYFWAVLRRTLAFCVVNVSATMVIGTLIALLLIRLRPRMRTLVSLSLLLAWAMPALTATVVWQWLFDTRYGLVNWLLTGLGGDFQDHSWLSSPLSFYFVASIIVTWMGVPFVAFTLHAGMTQISGEVMEAAAIDGAGAWERFRDITLPTLRPLFLILLALSTLWDLRVFTQIFVLQRAGGIARDTNLIGVYAYRVSIGENRFDTGAAVAVVMVGLTMLLTLGYLRQMFRQEEV